MRLWYGIPTTRTITVVRCWEMKERWSGRLKQKLFWTGVMPQAQMRSTQLIAPDDNNTIHVFHGTFEKDQTGIADGLKLSFGARLLTTGLSAEGRFGWCHGSIIITFHIHDVHTRSDVRTFSWSVHIKGTQSTTRKTKIPWTRLW